MDGNRRGGLGWLAFSAAVAVMPVIGAVSCRRTLVWRDTAKLYAPLRPLVESSLREGRLPLWNPYEGAGMPLLAQSIHGVLHPASLLTALLGPGPSLDLLVGTYLALAAIGAWLMARAFEASPEAAALAAVAYSLSGFVLSMIGNLPYLAGAASAPFVVAAARVLGRGRAGVLALAVATAVLHLAGDPQWSAVAALLGLAVAAEAGGLRAVPRWAAGVVVGTALAGIQLVTSWSFLERTVRAARIPALERAQWALAPARLVELVVPGFFSGRPLRMTAPVFEWLGGTTGFGLPFAASVFVGAPVLLLAAAGTRSARRARALAWAVPVLLWLALGDRCGAGMAGAHVPIWRQFRYAEKLVAPLTLVLAVLAALGADRLARARSRALLWCSLGGVVSFLGVAGLAPILVPAAEGRSAAVIAARESLSVGALHAAVALAALAGLLVALDRWEGIRSHAAMLCAAIVLLGSAAAAPFALHASNRRALAPPDAARLSPPVRLITPTRPLVPTGPEGLDQKTAWESRLGFPPYCALGRVDNIDVYTGLYPGRWAALHVRLFAEHWKAYQRFAVTHVALPVQGERDALEGARVVLDGDIRVYGIPHREWASFAPAARATTNRTRTLEWTIEAALKNDPAVVVEAPSAPPTGPGRVLDVQRGIDRVRIDAEAEGDALLVVNDAYWPGWRAELDGKPVSILPADVLVRAVAWPEGRHVLDMRYDPPEGAVGWWVTGAGALAILGLSIWAWRRARPGTIGTGRDPDDGTASSGAH